MKAAIAVCVFVLVASLCQVDAVQPAVQVPGRDGKLIPCKSLPAGLTDRCVKYSCDSAGSVSVLGCSLARIQCKEGQVVDEGKQDLTKVYPACCPQPTCRDA